ncbi:sulfotransferase [Oceanicoccus sp. KOV_DT_Chl]|uniref:sulfotransferase family protein n=1 Tax=Oceanicoccus sp. KOV_DT_Chl TaxID=1904639 RepID=UPI000C7A2656|nr:sulfotransferase [Oceanicoccus sp. KOV_DT_Chl]
MVAINQNHIPRLPLPIRCFNGAGKIFNTVGIKPVNLSPTQLMAEAQSRSGLSDFGDDYFRQPFNLLMQSMEEEAGLTWLGRIIARGEILKNLQNRLKLVDAFKKNPALADQPVHKPMLIVGLPRTGTSIMHELMAQDPENRVPMTWEVEHPFPAPETATFKTDPRIAAVEKNLSGVDKLMPEFKKMHPMGAEFPQECVVFTGLDFASVIFDTQYRLPTYQRWLDQADLSQVYKNHRRFLQFLQSKTEVKQWVLKTPGHLWVMDQLMAEYPDANIIQTHRDPIRVLTSVSSLIATLRSMASDQVDIREVAAHQAELLSDALNRAMATRAAGKVPDDQVIDVHFKDFMQDPVAMMDRIYQHFGRTLSDQAAANMQQFLAANPSDKHGRHSYSFADTGLDLATERQRFGAYQSHFDIASEAV